jgi:hypothetical protein
MINTRIKGFRLQRHMVGLPQIGIAKPQIRF